MILFYFSIVKNNIFNAGNFIEKSYKKQNLFIVRMNLQALSVVSCGLPKSHQGLNK